MDNKYEGMFILRSDLTKEVLDKALDQIKELITKHNGSISDIKEWARQRLAYPIKKHKEGIYYLINFRVAPEAISKIKKALSLNEAILRLMILKLKD